MPETNTKIAENPGSSIVGRPTEITEYVVLKLIDAFKAGMNDTKACQYAKIGRTTYYAHFNNDEDFRNKMLDAKDFKTLLAGKVAIEVLQKGSYRDKGPMARWMLENTMPKEYGKTIKVTGKPEYVPPDWFEEAEVVEDDKQLTNGQSK